MNKTILITLLAGFTLLSSASCTKKNQEGEFIRNCTGDYIKINKNIFRVFNYEITQNFESGDRVELNYTFDKPDQVIVTEPEYVCEMYFSYKDDIYITEIH